MVKVKISDGLGEKFGRFDIFCGAAMAEGHTRHMEAGYRPLGDTPACIFSKQATQPYRRINAAIGGVRRVVVGAKAPTRHEKKKRIV